MRPSSLLWLSVAFVMMLSTGPGFAQPAPDVATLVKGLQQRRAHFRTIAGRVVIGRKALRADTPEPQPSLTLVDFARDGVAYRIEQREVFVPTLRWYLCYGALNRQRDTDKPIEPQHLYSSLICDGKTVFRFDRSMNTCSIAPVTDPARAAAMSDAQGFSEGIGSSAGRAFGDMVGDSRVKWLLDPAWTRTVQGVDTVEGHACYRVLARSNWSKGEGTENGRTFYRLWIAPDLDYGVVRTEEVYAMEKKGLIHCVVQRTRGWAKDDCMDLWVPESWQMDSFHWTGVKEMRLQGPGWDQTMAVARMALTNRPDAVSAALRTDNPALYADELSPLLSYQPPDEFGMKLTPATDIKALFEGP
jgi:hypothetical protein